MSIIIGLFIGGAIIVTLIGSITGLKKSDIVLYGLKWWIYALALVWLWQILWGILNQWEYNYKCIGLAESSSCDLIHFIGDPFNWAMFIVFSFPGFIIGTLILFHRRKKIIRP